MQRQNNNSNIIQRNNQPPKQKTQNKNNLQNNSANHMINQNIPFNTIRVLNDEGEFLGTMSKNDALRLAFSKNLDLVLIGNNNNNNPPLAKITDYKKYLYTQSKKKKKQQRDSKKVETKKMLFRPNIGLHDLETKTKKIVEFVDEGHNVSIQIIFRGREKQHKDLGEKIVQHLLKAVKPNNYKITEKENMIEVWFPSQ